MPESPPYENTIHEALGIRGVELTPDRVIFEADVGPKVVQPMGILHGGASAVLAESAASVGAYLNCETDQYAAGIELNITHLRSKSSGTVRAIATPIRKGRRIHVWGIDIEDETGALIAVARCIVAIKRSSHASE